MPKFEDKNELDKDFYFNGWRIKVEGKLYD